MRELSLNGYIDEESWFGDEITPDSLHELLYGKDNAATDDVHIRLNSYGGSCNAATRMFDDIRAYPGSVKITVSGTAASAATVLCMAADRLEMTPGSLWMIHDPSVTAWGNERDLEEAVRLLRACKESILNVYGRRCRKSRDEIGAMMRDTTWMDAGQALQEGFIDGIVDMGNGVINSAFCHETSLAQAREKVAAWMERSRPKCIQNADKDQDCKASSSPSISEPEIRQQAEPQIRETQQAKPERADAPKEHPATPSGTPAIQLQKRLELITPTKR